MAKKSNKKARGKKQSRGNSGRASGSRRPKSRVRSAKVGPLSDARVYAWDQLLRDPCSAQMAQPCYTGVDSGYLVRTTDLYNPIFGATAGSVGAVTFGDSFIQYSPSNVSTTTGLIIGSPGAALQAAGTSNFVTTAGGAVKRYRPVACCFKYIPTGPYTTRAGLIGMGYSPGQLEVLADTGATTAPRAVLQSCQHTASVGVEPHEVRWLPTNEDETFTTTAAPIQAGVGCVFISLLGVDCTYVSPSQISPNGIFEITTVWEWIPTASGITVSPSAPLPYTSQQVLSTINDMGAYLFRGIRKMASNPGVVNAAANYGVQLIARSAQSTYRSSSLMQ